MIKSFLFIFFINIICYSSSQNVKTFKRRLIYPTSDGFRYYIAPYLNSKSIAKVYNDFHKIDPKFTLEKCFPGIFLKVYKLFNFHKPRDNSQNLYHALLGTQNVILCTKTKTARALKRECQNHEFSTKVDLWMLVNDNISETIIEYEIDENKKALIFIFEKKFALFAKIDSELIFICLGNNCKLIENINTSLLVPTLNLETRVGDVVFEFPRDLQYFFKAKFSAIKYPFFLKSFSWIQIFIEKYNNFLYSIINKLTKIFQSLPVYIGLPLFFIFYLPYSILHMYVWHLPYTIQSLVFTVPISFYMDRCTFINIAAYGPIMPLLAAFQNSFDFTCAGVFPKRIDILASRFKSKSVGLGDRRVYFFGFLLFAFLTTISNFVIMGSSELFGYDFCVYRNFE